MCVNFRQCALVMKIKTFMRMNRQTDKHFADENFLVYSIHLVLRAWSPVSLQTKPRTLSPPLPMPGVMQWIRELVVQTHRLTFSLLLLLLAPFHHLLMTTTTSCSLGCARLLHPSCCCCSLIWTLWKTCFSPSNWPDNHRSWRSGDSISKDRKLEWRLKNLPLIMLSCCSRRLVKVALVGKINALWLNM